MTLADTLATGVDVPSVVVASLALAVAVWTLWVTALQPAALQITVIEPSGLVDSTETLTQIEMSGGALRQMHVQLRVLAQNAGATAGHIVSFKVRAVHALDATGAVLPESQWRSGSVHLRARPAAPPALLPLGLASHESGTFVLDIALAGLPTSADQLQETLLNVAALRIFIEWTDAQIGRRGKLRLRDRLHPPVDVSIDELLTAVEAHSTGPRDGGRRRDAGNVSTGEYA